VTARIGIDVGGTFTDVVLYDDSSRRLERTKVFSVPERGGEVILEALERLGVDPADLSMFVHATTLVTNLIIERRGAKVGLLTTRGFRDVLEIGLSYREHPYDLQFEKARPLVPRPLRRELTERIAAGGAVVEPLDPEEVLRETEWLVEQGVEAVAVVFLHSYANPDHERAARQAIAERFPDLRVSISSEVDPEIREFERCSTTVLNAYAMPAIVHYNDQLERDLAADGADLLYMHSGGGVVPPARARARPVELVSSGPAGGVLAAAYLGRQLGLSDIVTFDTGGTSSDVCMIENGDVQERDSIEVEWGMPLRARCIDVTWVGAGGGSIGWVDSGGALRVGPRSAGAAPGPACYGQGGTQPTVTDANLVLGLLDPERFLGGRVRLDVEAARRAVDALAADFGTGREELALGMRRIVTANMAQAVHAITVQKGIDPRSFTLIAFGGAGGQHATDVAAEMEITRVLFPPLASTFSAFGLLCADIRVTERRAFLNRVADNVREDAEKTFRDLHGRAAEALGSTNGGPVVEHRFAHLRYEGQTHELVVPVDPEGWSRLPELFEAVHERRFGTRLGDPVEAVALGVTLASPQPTIPLPRARVNGVDGRPAETRVFGIDEPVATYERAALPPGSRLAGPCILFE
jgi:N-methylhydantoinase A/oxoprolinase/acetone carboxylase beta subunit